MGSELDFLCGKLTLTSMTQEQIHTQIVHRLKAVTDWFHSKKQNLSFPFYSSFDLRDSGYKVVPVDANIFPAGFNNICRQDRESSAELVRGYLATHYPERSKNIVLLTEEHTNNPYYWDNVSVLKELFEKAGRKIVLAIPRSMPAPLELQSASGVKLQVHSAVREGSGVVAGGMTADLVISNNDFSNAYEEWVAGLQTPINPPHDLGWHRRRKDQFFSAYNRLASEFAEVLAVDPFYFQVETRHFAGFDVNSEASRGQLAEQVDGMLADLKGTYESRGISTKPFAFVKNSAGTYGLAVSQVHSGEDVRQWNYKARKKMKAAKGGRDVEEVIIQEGVPTIVTASGSTAEPAIYMIGCQLAGGFLRTHSEKNAEESLNSPGAIYQKLCVSDLNVSVEGHPMENVYGWVGKLSFLAIAQEAKNSGVEFPSYQPGPCQPGDY